MSRLRSGRGSNPSAGSRAAAAPRARGVLVPAAKSNVYVALLGISLAAVVISCILMAILLNQYEWKVSVSSSAPTPSALAAAPFQLASLAAPPAVTTS